jgi:hypothetical protein
MIEPIGSSQYVHNLQPGRASAIGARSLNNFDIEDESIISAQARILNELEKYNSGEGNELDLALTCKMGELQVEATINVIKTKNEMLDAVMDMME